MNFDLPRGWSLKTLSDCCTETISYGIVQPGTHYEDGVSVIRVNNFKKDGLELSDVLKVTQAVSDKYKRTVLKGGEVLLTLVGSTGQSVVVPKSMAGWNVPRAIAVLRVSDDVGAEWVNCCLQSPITKYFLDARANTTVQKTLNLKDVKDIPIPVPPKDYKEQALSTLVSLSQKLDTNRKINQTLEEIAQAIFKSWFVDFDPVKAKMNGEQPEGMEVATASLFPEKLVESELGLIPEGWEETPLYDIAEYINGAAYKKFEPNGEGLGLPIVKIAELKAGVTSKTGFSTVDMPQKYKLDDTDILFSWSGNPDTSIDTFVWALGEAWLNQHIFKVVPKSDLSRDYVLCLLKYMRPVFAEIARDKQTTGLGHVTVKDLKRLTVAVPSEELLIKFNEKVSAIIAHNFSLVKENQTLEKLRDTLLPKLLSGEIDLDKVLDV